MRRAGDMTESILLQPKFLEPGAGVQEVSNLDGHWTTTLPEDLLKEQSLRLQLFYAVGVILWAINCAMDIGLTPHGDRGPYRLLIEGIGAAFAAAVAVYIRFGRSDHRAKIRLGVAAVVPHAFGLALLDSWTQQTTAMRPISPITVLILFFGLLAPAQPTQTLAAGLIAASMDPLGVWIAHLRGLETPALFSTFAMFYPNYVCAVLAVAPARILHRLGRQIREARAHRAAVPARSRRFRPRLSAQGPGAPARQRRRIGADGHHLQDSGPVGPAGGPKMVGSPSSEPRDAGEGHTPTQDIRGRHGSAEKVSSLRR